MIRGFTSQLDDETAVRSVDDDAPTGLRQELIDLAFHGSPRSGRTMKPDCTR